MLKLSRTTLVLTMCIIFMHLILALPSLSETTKILRFTVDVQSVHNIDVRTSFAIILILQSLVTNYSGAYDDTGLSVLRTQYKKTLYTYYNIATIKDKISKKEEISI